MSSSLFKKLDLEPIQLHIGEILLSFCRPSMPHLFRVSTLRGFADTFALVLYKILTELREPRTERVGRNLCWPAPRIRPLSLCGIKWAEGLRAADLARRLGIHNLMSGSPPDKLVRHPHQNLSHGHPASMHLVAIMHPAHRLRLHTLLTTQLSKLAPFRGEYAEAMG